MGVVAYSLLLFATFSLVSSDCWYQVTMNDLFSSGTDEALNRFWTSFDLTCTEAVKQAVKTRIEKCAKEAAKACELIYNKAMSDCAVIKVKDVNNDCDAILSSILAGSANDGAKFSKLLEKIATQVCVKKDQHICKDAVTVCEDMDTEAAEVTKACGTLDAVNKFMVLITTKEEEIDKFRFLVTGKKYRKFAEAYLSITWAPKDSITWKATGCATLKDDLICKVINEKCASKDANFQAICKSKTDEKPTAASEKAVIKEKEESYTGIIITACCVLLIIAMSVGCFVFQIIKKNARRKKLKQETPAGTPEKSAAPNSQSAEGAEKKEEAPPKDGKPRHAPTQGGGSQMNQAPPQPVGEKKPQSQSKPPSLS